MPEWLASKKCIYAIDKINDNLYVWRCLAIHQRITKKQKRPEEDTNRDALRLARDFYGNPKLKSQEVRATRKFGKIAKHCDVNIRLFEPKTDSQEVWKLVYGKGQASKINKPCVDIVLYDGHCFYIKDIELLTKHWECVGCQQRFNRHDNYNSHTNNGMCTGGKAKVICQGQKFKKIMSSSEKVFYGGNTQFSCVACKWIERQAELLGKHIHHPLCGHGGEYCVTINKKETLIDGYEPESRTIFQYYGCKLHGCPCQKERSQAKYDKTLRLEATMKKRGYSVASVWECQKPEFSRKKLKKKFIPYPYFIVYDFEALLEKINDQQTEDLTINSKHVHYQLQ